MDSQRGMGCRWSVRVYVSHVLFMRRLIALMRLSVGAQMLRAVMEELPEEGPRLVAGLHNPLEIIEVC